MHSGLNFVPYMLHKKAWSIMKDLRRLMKVAEAKGILPKALRRVGWILTPKEKSSSTFDQLHQSVLRLWNDRYSSVFFPRGSGDLCSCRRPG